MGYIEQKFKRNTKKAKFIKITKAGFFESMVHSVEMINNGVNINYDTNKVLLIIFYFFTNQISVHAETKYFSQGKKIYDKNKLDDAKIFFEKD